MAATLDATATIAPVARSTPRPCSNGLVALTFDDGPSRTVTPRLLDVLREKRVPATFFVVGQRVAAEPGIVRRAHRAGFLLANHTFAHERLTSLSAAGIRRTLRRTRAAVVAAGAEMSRLMRPPYGLIDSRVRGVVSDLGLVPVLWTVDPRDWAGAGAEVIADRVISALRPDQQNVVLLHDGVANSPRTLSAVPDIIRRARARGYCFAGLGAGGRPAPPVPGLRVHGATVVEKTGEQARLRFAVSLDRPTSRLTSVRIRTADRSARAGSDYAAVARRLWFPVGVTRKVVEVRVFGDHLDEWTERLTLDADRPRGVALLDASSTGQITDDDRPPKVSVEDVALPEPAAVDSAWVQVPVVLSRPSGRQVSVTVATVDGTATTDDFVPVEATVVIPAGEVEGAAAVEVLADDEVEASEQFTVVIQQATRATITDGTATVSIDPPLALRLRLRLP